MKIARNRLGTAVAAAALLALTACSNDADGPQVAPTPSESASVSESPLPSASASPSEGTPKIEVDPKTGQVDYCKDQKTPFTGEAADKWGEDKVMTAYCDLVELSMEQSFVPDLMRKDSGFRAVEFSIPRDLMTVEARADWDKKVAQVVKGNDEDVRGDVWALTLYNADFGDKYEFYPAGEQPTTVNRAFTAADTWVQNDNGVERLGMEFALTGDFLVTDGKDAYLFPFEKTVSFVLLENGSHPDKPWLIDGWSGNFEFGKPTLRGNPPTAPTDDPSADTKND